MQARTAETRRKG